MYLFQAKAFLGNKVFGLNVPTLHTVYVEKYSSIRKEKNHRYSKDFLRVYVFVISHKTYIMGTI